MAQVTVDINGRAYVVGCEDGREGHLLQLARLFDAQVRQVSDEVGQLSEARLLLMGALLMADELADARARLSHGEAELNRLRAERGQIEERAAQAVDAAARRIEALAGEAG